MALINVMGVFVRGIPWVYIERFVTIPLVPLNVRATCAAGCLRRPGDDKGLALRAFTFYLNAARARER